MIVGVNKKIEVGDKACIKEIVTKEIVERYCEISGDYNPIHWDSEYTNSTFFGRCIAHGLFCLGMISKLIGMELPGAGAIFINERLEYKRPCYINDTITASVEISEIIEKKRLVKVSICCTNQENDVVLEGDSLLKVI